MRYATTGEILNGAPIYGYGGKQAFFSVGCCWWTSDAADLGKVAGSGLPCCPHCGSLLMEGPLEYFIQAARTNPGHYGILGLKSFVAAHAGNSPTCRSDWDDYCGQVRAG
jgi:hypothetical protein